MEWLILGAFSAALLLCIITGRSILIALAFGLLLFLLYGRRKGYSWRALGGMALSGIRTVSNILITFFLIGVLTAFWRAAGTIPMIVCYASAWIKPSIFLLMTFLLNGLVSTLTGTSFGTSATMGVICATMGNAMGVSPVLTGGAVLSGAFVGDRCSPVSTSALLVSAVTGTDIYRNIRNMLRSALVPFLASCAVYLVIGFRPSGAGDMIDLNALFSKQFSLHWSALLPAVVILTLSLCRVNVKLAMTASIVTAVPLCLFLQHIPAGELLRAAVLGFWPEDAEVAAMVSGGGVLSMCRVAGIVCLSSSYSEIFRKTGLLDGAKRIISGLAQRSTAFIATLVTSVVAGMIACNQTLTILLVTQLCGDLQGKPHSTSAHSTSGVEIREAFALDLEDSAVVVAPLIPWSIAGAVPLSAIGAPTGAILASFYLFLLPLWRVAGEKKQKEHSLPLG